MNVETAKAALRRKNPVGSWTAVGERLLPTPRPHLRPSFTLPAQPSVYTVGSCFARNVEEYLDLIGAEVPTLGFSVPKSEWNGLRTNGILNKYTPAAIYEDFFWASQIVKRGDGFQAADADKFLFELASGDVIDLQLAGYKPVSRERAVARRKELFELIRKAFEVDCVTITLGLTEAWKKGDMFVQQPPASRDLLRVADQFEFCCLDSDTCRSLVQSSIDILKTHNPEVRVIVTVSPVPLERTFTEQDVILANMTSKSILRTVAAQVTAANDNVDYFPSYEIVTQQDRALAFEEDLRHVRSGIVGDIVSLLLENYMPDLSSQGQLFQAAASELGKKSPDASVFEMLLSSKIDLAKLSYSQLTTYLRVCWRLRHKPKARAAGALLMQSPIRRHSTLRAVGHVFPRIGMAEESKAYATDILKQDPSNELAQKVLAQ